MDYKGIKKKTFLNKSSDKLIPVLYCAPEGEQQKYFEDISNFILKVRQDVVLYYADKQENITKELMDEVKLVVAPITRAFFYSDCLARIQVFPYALENKIPVLPILKEDGIQFLFNATVGDYHLFDDSYPEPVESMLSEDSRRKKLEAFLNKVLKEDSLVERISREFTGEIFLSYRKKDSKYLEDVMSAVHLTKYTVDFSIWYDNYLIPGENYDDDISAHLNNADAFVLLVTPNLLEEGNYVMACEYPNAIEQGKIIIPVEAEETDYVELSKKYPGISRPIPLNNREAISDYFDTKADRLKVADNREPEHLYYTGMAALKGIGGELDYIKAATFFFNASQGGYDPATDMLIEMYSNPKYGILLLEDAWGYQIDRINTFAERHNPLSREAGIELVRMIDKAVCLALEMERYEDAVDVASDAVDYLLHIISTYNSTLEDAVLLASTLKKYADCMMLVPAEREHAEEIYKEAMDMCDIAYEHDGFHKDADKIRMIAPLALVSDSNEWFRNGFDIADKYKEGMKAGSGEDVFYLAYSIGLLMVEFCQFHVEKQEKTGEEMSSENIEHIEAFKSQIEGYIRMLGEGGYANLSYDLLKKYYVSYGAYQKLRNKIEEAKDLCFNAFRLFVSNDSYDDYQLQIDNCNRLIYLSATIGDYDTIYYVKEYLYDVYTYLYEATDNIEYSDIALRIEEEQG